LRVWENHYKLLFRGIFWNWCTNESYRTWILNSICMVKFTNAITNNLWKIWNLEFKIPSKFDYKQNINLFLNKICWNGFKIWHSWCSNFLNFFCCANLWPHFGKAIFELKSMQIWLGQNFTYFYVHNFSKE
jgi:hypothetical protein